MAIMVCGRLDEDDGPMRCTRSTLKLLDQKAPGETL